jgi:predicted HTH transcriptional regulator
MKLTYLVEHVEAARIALDLAEREAAQRLGISQRAVEKQIEKLKKEGRLHRAGPDNGGHWEVLEESR